VNKKILVRLPDGTIIKRVPKIVSFGNFQQIVVKYNNEEYIVGDGDEYLRGEKEVYDLGKKLTNKLIKGKAWDKLPFLKEQVDKGCVWLYDSKGFARELTDKHKNKIAEIESNNKNLKVIAVLEGTYILGGVDKATMTSYVYLDNDYKPWIIEDNAIGFYAVVVNESWDIEEAGSVGITETVGLVRRVM